VTAQILLPLAETMTSICAISPPRRGPVFRRTQRDLSDPLFRQIDLPKQSCATSPKLCPGVTHSLQRLYAAYTEAAAAKPWWPRNRRPRRGARFEANPIERVRDLIEAKPQLFSRTGTDRRNPARRVERAGEALFAALRGALA